MSDDLCNWEFVNQFDFDLCGDEDDDDSIYEFESVDLVESLDSLSSSSSEDEEDEESPITDLDAHGVVDVMIGSPSPSQPPPCHDRVIDWRHNYVSGMYYADDHDKEEDEDEDDDEDDHGYEIDDELVPWGVKDRFERQRMRKLGKRAFAKMAKSKKSVLLYTKPGCVFGKHGLGLKAY